MAPSSPTLTPVAATGDNESVTLDERGKLSKFKPESKEWANLGVGAVRIFTNDLTKRARLSFTNATGRVLINSFLYKGMSCGLKPKSHVEVTIQGSNSNLEKLLIKFKSDALCASFKATLDKLAAQQ